MSKSSDFDVECCNAANQFVSLPFAFIGADEARRLSDEIRAGDVRNAMDLLRDDMATHFDCGNIIKHDREDEVYRMLVRIALRCSV